MGPLGKGKLTYADAFAAIGRFVAQKHMTDVCVLEFEHGVIVSGSVLFVTGERYHRQIETHVFSDQDLLKMIKGA
ncbi:MAG: hypothetical protein WCF84_24030 [Anaerolineae bacterium]